MKTIILLLGVCLLGACTTVEQQPPTAVHTTTTATDLRPTVAETQVIRSY